MGAKIGQAAVESLVKRFGSPLYIYDADIISERCRELHETFPGFRIYYACKANTNLEIMKRIYAERFGIECVSPGEITAAEKAGAARQDIAFTCGSIHEKELVSIAKKGIRMHLDSLTQVAQFGSNFPGRSISVRLNLGVGAGENSHVITGGPNSKFGIDSAHIPALKRLAKRYRLRVTGLHQHIGSNILDIPTFLRAMEVLFRAAMQFRGLEHLDFGGGLGVPYRSEKRLDIKKLGKAVAARVQRFSRIYGRTLKMSFEPGRYIVAEAGYLAVTVVDIKRNPKKTFVGVDSGMGHLIRPAMYDSHHEIVNVTRPNARKEKVTIAGWYCESGDVLAKDRMLPMPKLGDILILKNAGAYGYAMSSDYNLRPKPLEILVSSGHARRI